jgi:homoserine O-acetyltransferase
MINDAELRVLYSPYGHCAGAPGRFVAETVVVEQAIRELLEY